MSRAYSSDLRQRIVDAITQGETRRAAAAAFKVSPATAVRLKQRADRTGSVEPSRRGRPSGGGKLAPYQDAIIAKVEAQSDITMPDLATWLEEHHGVKVDPSNLSKLLCRAGFTFKKNAAGIGTRTRRRAPGTQRVARTSPTRYPTEPRTSRLRGRDVGQD